MKNEYPLILFCTSVMRFNLCDCNGVCAVCGDVTTVQTSALLTSRLPSVFYHLIIMRIKDTCWLHLKKIINIHNFMNVGPDVVSVGLVTFHTNLPSHSLLLLRLTHHQVRSGQVRSGQVRSGLVRSGQVRSGLVRSGQVRSGQVWSGQSWSVWKV